jgi:DNA polymerase III delta prime subunit
MPSKPQDLHSELQQILAASNVSPEDRTLILKCARKSPAKLHHIIQREIADRQWSRYRKASRPEELHTLLWQDAQELNRLGKKAAIHHDKLKFRSQARVLEDIAEWLFEHRDDDKRLQQLLAGPKEDQKSAGKTIDDLVTLCMRAARNGLLNHPYINKMVTMQRLTYNKPLLRKAQIGLELHLPKPIEARQLEIEDMRGRGLSLQRIADRLKELDLNPEGKTLGKKGIHKRLKGSHRK